MKKLVVLPNTRNGYDEQLLLAKDYLVDETLATSIEELSLDLLTREQISVVVSSGLSREWFYILRGLGIVSITFNRRECYSDLSDIVIDYQDESGDSYFS